MILQTNEPYENEQPQFEAGSIRKRDPGDERSAERLDILCIFCSIIELLQHYVPARLSCVTRTETIVLIFVVKQGFWELCQWINDFKYKWSFITNGFPLVTLSDFVVFYIELIFKIALLKWYG